jgi:hypothetical protein
LWQTRFLVNSEHKRARIVTVLSKKVKR